MGKWAVMGAIFGMLRLVAACAPEADGPSHETCALLQDRKACLAAGCTDFKSAKFGRFEGEVCWLEQEIVPVCVVREVSRGVENNAQQGYQRTDEDGHKVVMLLDSDVDALKGWSRCERDSYCGCSG